jgi:xylan 1,4-beta-xylosidase
MLVAEPTVTMYVDTANVSQTRLQCGDLLLSCVGASHAVMSLREDWRAHLTQIQRDVGFRYIRFHGLLDDDMSTYLEGKANMFNIFNTFDFLIGIGIRPIVELSFMPIALALNSSQTVFHYKGGTSAPKDWELWYKFISEV